MDKFADCMLELDADGNDGTIVVPGLAALLIEVLVLSELDMEEDAMGKVPVEIPCPLELDNEPYVPAEVLELDEDRCRILQYALIIREGRVEKLRTYRNAKARRQGALDRVNRNKAVWARMTPNQRKAHSKGFKEAQDRNWATFHEAKEEARNAWAAYEAYKQDFSELESDAWKDYFEFVENSQLLQDWSWELSQLRRTEFNRFNTTGYGSELHDEAWVNQDLDNPGTRIDDEFQAHCEYWGHNRTWLPAKDRRRAMYKARATKVSDSMDMDAFEALVSSLD